MRFVPVTALDVALRFDGADRPVGRLALVDRRVLFEFDGSFQADPLPLSPARLPVRPGVHEDAKRTFDGLFGLFDDSLPDGWGRLLLDRDLDQRGIGRERVTVLDRLAFVGEHGPGALIYHPAHPAGAPPAVVAVRALAAEATAVLDGDASTVFPALLAAGGSSGGARPKALIALRPADGAVRVGHASVPDGYVAAIVKFHNHGDPVDAGAIEHAYAAMARAAGLDVAPTWLLAADRGRPGYFATARFDRAPRVHVHSLCGLLHASHRCPSTDYEGLLKTTRFLTRDQRAVDQVFRRMVFNVLAGNRDDHSRNFAFQMDATGAWTPTPAFDLTHSGGPAGEHWMTVAREGRAPDEAHLMRVADAVGVTRPVAREAIDAVRAAVAGWRAFAAASGVGRASMARVAKAIS